MVCDVRDINIEFVSSSIVYMSVYMFDIIFVILEKLKNKCKHTNY